MNPLRILIVDDERLARQQLRGLLDPYAGIEIAGEASGVSEAISLLELDTPEVVFLDISMPPESGFDLLPHLPLATRVVFVTAHASHAVRAFEENSMDYLLKPVTPERLALTMKRLGENGLLLAGERHVLLGDGGSLVKLPMAHISAVFAEANYSRVHSREGGKFLLRRPLREWLAELEATHLVQLNRSMLVNPAAILQLEKQGRDGGIIRLQGIKDPIPLGREAMRLATQAISLGAAR
ncbi:response regulator [bacterium]|nr:response regulator [bacterium]